VVQSPRVGVMTPQTMRSPGNKNAVRISNTVEVIRPGMNGIQLVP